MLTVAFYAYVISNDPKQFTIDFTPMGSDFPTVEVPLE